MTAQAERLDALNALIAERLPTALRAHTRLAAVRDGCLVLLADSPAWAAQLRYRTPELLANLPPAPEFAAVQSIRVRSSPTAQLAPAAPARAQLSHAAAAALSAHAECIEDEALRAALQRLARHARD